MSPTDINTKVGNFSLERATDEVLLFTRNRGYLGPVPPNRDSAWLEDACGAPALLVLLGGRS